jgi:hypothetical protein
MARCAPVVLSLGGAFLGLGAGDAAGCGARRFLAEVRVASHHLPLTGRKD